MDDKELFDKKYYATPADRAASVAIDHCPTCVNLRFGKDADKRKLAQHLSQAHDMRLGWMEKSMP
jgi:hypothetical protein